MQRSRLFASTALAALLATFAASRLPAGDTPAEKRDKINDNTEINPSWIYDDLPSAIAKARRENKPIFAVFR
ncbi:MAG: hypothetical protein FD180_457 [Planctomycetota bacterium]|nr:MAG: hypothetical protein FD180_457 [Planctomycetota bacterium]